MITNLEGGIRMKCYVYFIAWAGKSFRDIARGGLRDEVGNEEVFLKKKIVSINDVREIEGQISVDKKICPLRVTFYELLREEETQEDSQNSR